NSDLVQLGGLSPTPPVFHVDPVCKMRVMPETAAGSWEFEGTTYYFCAPRCLERFRANPQSFLKPVSAEPAPVSGSGIYTCPMHPEIRQEGPGSCPKCGMALEPEVASVEEGPNPELADMTRRFRV